MGSVAHIRLVGGRGTEPADLSGVLVELDRRLDELEQRWSRFVSGSDVSRLNSAAGRGLVVHRDTQVLVETAIAAWNLSSGAFDPTVHDAIVAAGYDRDFARLASDGPPEGAQWFDEPTPGCVGIRVDRDLGVVGLPAGVGFDAGGIGKGLAADLLVAHALCDGENNVEGALVNLGGDLRVAGRCDDGLPGWLIELDEPGVDPLNLSLVEGAVATSSRLRRTWSLGGQRAHHLIDPHTGRSTTDSPRVVTVVAARAWVAEVLAKTLHVRWRSSAHGQLGELLDRRGAAALVIDDSGAPHRLGGMEDYLQ